jgi:hypothetical protein
MHQPLALSSVVSPQADEVGLDLACESEIVFLSLLLEYSVMLRPVVLAGRE